MATSPVQDGDQRRPAEFALNRDEAGLLEPGQPAILGVAIEAEAPAGDIRQRDNARFVNSANDPQCDTDMKRSTRQSRGGREPIDGDGSAQVLSPVG